MIAAVNNYSLFDSLVTSEAEFFVISARLASHVFMLYNFSPFFATVPADVASPESGSKFRCIKLL